MSRLGLRSWTLAVLLCCLPATGWAVSAVFAGDPVNPATGLPYEILPGFPLIQPGPDGLFDTADDVVDSSTVGDIDMVVRSGAPAANATIPAPTVQSGRNAVPVGVAGSTASGGTEIPFTVFLSDGATDGAALSGHLLAAAADMDGIPVVVSAFADFDGDGFIGPTNNDDAGAADNHLEVRELDPVGRAVAVFSGGVARGSMAIHAGLPASQGGLAVALCGMALTGPYDAAFFGGTVPSGPGISSALPFIPQRDMTKLIRDRAVPVGPTTTLQNVVEFAVLPSADAPISFALPLDGSNPTIDVAIVQSQPAVQVAFRAAVSRAALEDLSFGNIGSATGQELRLVPLDRWNNPADPAPDFRVRLRATRPLRIARPARARGARRVALRASAGIAVTVKAPPHLADGTSGALTAERDGIILAAVTYRVDARNNRPAADVSVPSSGAATIQAAIDRVTDRNHDGQLIIDVAPGLYGEHVVVNRSVVLRGDGADTTLLRGSGDTNVVAVTASNAEIRGLSAVGGATGFALNGANTRLGNSRAWHNQGAGIAVTGSNSRVWRVESVDNGGDGLQLTGATGAVCSESAFTNNLGAGATLSGLQNAQLDNNRIADNAGGGSTGGGTAASGTAASGEAGGAGGISLTAVTASIVTDNQCTNNLLIGLQMVSSQNNQIVGNLVAGNDDDGVHTDQTSNNLVSGNSIDSNKGVGLSVRRSTNDDFSVALGVQAPPGDNDSSNNRKGDVLVRTK